jgi:hypothetical protein
MSTVTKAGAAIALAVVGFGALGVTSSAPGSAKAADSKPQSCFFASDINGFEAPDDQTVYIRVGASDLFKLDLTPNCTGLRFRQDIAIRSSPSEGGFICTPLQAEVVYRESGIPEVCPVTALHKLSKAEIAATPKKDLP